MDRTAVKCEKSSDFLEEWEYELEDRRIDCLVLDTYALLLNGRSCYPEATKSGGTGGQFLKIGLVGFRNRRSMNSKWGADTRPGD